MVEYSSINDNIAEAFNFNQPKINEDGIKFSSTHKEVN